VLESRTHIVRGQGIDPQGEGQNLSLKTKVTAKDSEG